MESMTHMAKTIAGSKSDKAISKINQHFWKSLEDVNKSDLMSVEQKIDFVVGLLFMADDIEALEAGRALVSAEGHSDEPTHNISMYYDNFIAGHNPEDIDMMIHGLESKARTLLSNCHDTAEKHNIMQKFSNMYSRLQTV